VIQDLLDRLAIAEALARCRDRDDDRGFLDRSLPAFTPAGSRAGDPGLVGLDWSRLPEEHLRAPRAAELLRRTLDTMPARYRAAALVDTEAVTVVDLAAGLEESPERVRRRVHQVRMAVRERLTHYFAAAAGRRSGGTSPC